MPNGRSTISQVPKPQVVARGVRSKSSIGDGVIPLVAADALFETQIESGRRRRSAHPGGLATVLGWMRRERTAREEDV